MKILAISDEETLALWDYYRPGMLDGYDMILACGDLKAEYLSFLVTMANIPVFYVHGNHDGKYLEEPPEGCDCVEDQIVEYKGVRILGLGGCRWYHPGPFQYTEWQMRKRIFKLWFQLWKHKAVDIVITHAPPQGVGDADDLAHTGFRAFLPFLDKYKPKYLLHGHVHMNYGANSKREQSYGETTVINVSGRYTLEF